MKYSHDREHTGGAQYNITQMSAYTDIKKGVTRFRFLGFSQYDLDFTHKKKRSYYSLHSSTPPHLNAVLSAKLILFCLYYLKNFSIIIQLHNSPLNTSHISQYQPLTWHLFL